MFAMLHCNVCCIRKYLNETTHYKLCYSTRYKDHLLIAYVVAVFARGIDDRRSKSGCLVYLNGGLVRWLNQSQEYVESSRIEVEYLAMTLACKEVVWLKRLLHDLPCDPRFSTKTAWSYELHWNKLIKLLMC
jgi:hypothetical protein